MPNQIINRRIVLKSAVTPAAATSVLQTWYDSLSVKPSAGLWSDLKTMADGMNSDGDWTEMDFMSMIACMETDEQRLRPLKTSSGDDMVKVGSPTLGASGVLNPVPGVLNYLDSKWNPTDNGVKFTLNNAFISVFGNTSVSVTATGAIFGSTSNAVSNKDYFETRSTTTTMQLGTNAYVNNTSGTAAVNKTLLDSAKTFHIGIKRTAGIGVNQGVKFVNTVTATLTIGSFAMTLNDLIILGINDSGTIDASCEQIVRGAICGSGSIDQNRCWQRISTFFTARGLTITNF